jgi:hypothetical protein
MGQPKQDRPNNVVPVRSEKKDSPTIQHLIEQLDRDMEETLRKASKAS